MILDLERLFGIDIVRDMAAMNRARRFHGGASETRGSAFQFYSSALYYGLQDYASRVVSYGGGTITLIKLCEREYVNALLAGGISFLAYLNAANADNNRAGDLFQFQNPEYGVPEHMDAE